MGGGKQAPDKLWLFIEYASYYLFVASHVLQDI